MSTTSTAKDRFVANPDCPFCLKLAILNDLPVGEIVWQFEYSVLFLGPWQFYQGYCILAARRHARELYDLPDSERRSYFDEMCLVAKAIQDCFHPHKLNYELLGNQVPHLHWHLFPRYQGDPNLLQPVWLALDRAERDEAERRRLETGTLDRIAITNALRKEIENYKLKTEN